MVDPIKTTNSENVNSPYQGVTDQPIQQETTVKETSGTQSSDNTMRNNGERFANQNTKLGSVAKGCALYSGMAVKGLGKVVGGAAMGTAIATTGLAALVGAGIGYGGTRIARQGHQEAMRNAATGAQIGGLSTALVTSALLTPLSITGKCIEGLGKIMIGKKEVPDAFQTFDESFKTSKFVLSSQIKVNNKMTPLTKAYDIVKGMAEKGTNNQEVQEEEIKQDPRIETEGQGDDARSEGEDLTVKSENAQLTKETLNSVLGLAVTNYPFNGYGVPGMGKKEDAPSWNATPAITSGKMKRESKGNAITPGIGIVSTQYTWNEKPKLSAGVPATIQNAGVHLPNGLSKAKYDEMRQLTGEGVSSGRGITNEQAQDLALSLGGVVIEATLPFKASALLQDGGADVNMHCIFQTGLNFAGAGGGGIPLTNTAEGAQQIEVYSQKNAEAAVQSAIRNKSDVLVFNLGIGTGFFGGVHGQKVLDANIKGICDAVIEARANGEKIEVVVPNVRLSDAQKAELSRAGIQVATADKDAVAALLAREGLTVSLSVAGDPMSMLGIHGPGFWWETAGSASDEERAAFLTPSYALGHIPIQVYEGNKPPTKIAALSQYMRK